MKDNSDLLKLERRARRAARREKQRAENIIRARAMHLIRVENPPQNQSAIKVSKRKRSHYHIGCSGWYYWHWNGTFYPESIPKSKWFDHYTKHFKTVELNAPFYSWPTVATVKSWIKQAGKKQIVYTVKVCELITHIKRFKGTKELVLDFGYIADLLGNKMGCFLFQLPPSFHYTASRLKMIINQLDLTRKNVVEFRHSSWWNETVFSAFRELGIIFCSCSGPRLPDQLVKTADDIYIRFHGTKQWYRHDYSRGELIEWAKRIKDSRAKRVWAYFNNDRDGYAIKNAEILIRLLKG
jgi:uncharacterized protein YecE (DUF72 family)